jgi:hypothetical protein
LCLILRPRWRIFEQNAVYFRAHRPSSEQTLNSQSNSLGL